jgi:hypothetical protein
VRADGGEIDLLGHDWGAGHVYGALSRRPDLVRTWTGDIAGVLHRNYVWHDMAQAWQTPDIGEQVVAGMASSSHDDKVALFEGLGLPTPIASALATGLDDEMGRCVLRLYRTGAQPAVGELGDRLAGMELPPGLVIDAAEDAYVASALSVEWPNVSEPRCCGSTVAGTGGWSTTWAASPTRSSPSGPPTELHLGSDPRCNTSLDGETEVAGDHQALDLAGALADLEDLGVAVEAGDG